MARVSKRMFRVAMLAASVSLFHWLKCPQRRVVQCVKERCGVGECLGECLLIFELTPLHTFSKKDQNQ